MSCVFCPSHPSTFSTEQDFAEFERKLGVAVTQGSILLVPYVDSGPFLVRNFSCTKCGTI